MHVCRFMDGYTKGLTGSLLAFAVKKYRGHRAMPAFLTRDLENEMKESKQNVEKNKKARILS